MKELVLFRHGKTEPHHGSGDFFRELTQRGIEQVPMMGTRLMETGFYPDAIFTSSASRAIQTADLISHVFGYDLHKIIIEKKLYLCEANDLMQFVKDLPEKFSSVIIVGHNNGLTDFINLFTEVKIVNLPTSGYSLLKNKVDQWQNTNSKEQFTGMVNYPSLS